MRHPNENLLLAAALEMLPPEAEDKLRAHLADCSDCAERYQSVSREVALIGGIEPTVATMLYPLPRPRRPSAVSWLRVAALLAVGFLAGFVSSRLLQPEPVRVVPHHLTAPVAAVSLDAAITCASVATAVDLSWLDSGARP
jgi:hypothetical protein